MVKCAVVGCNNYNGARKIDPSVKFVCFPKDPDLRLKWSSLCGNDTNFNFGAARVCTDHFTDQDWRFNHLVKVSNKKKHLKKGAIPSKNLPKIPHAHVKDDPSKQPELVDQTVTSYADVQEKEMLINFSEAEVHSKIKTESTSSEPTILEKLREENKRLRQEARTLIARFQKADPIVKNMEKIFSKAQIRRLKNPENQCYWKYEDVANSVSLFNASLPLYQMLFRRKYPVPSPSTLRKWLSTLKLRPGVIGTTLKTLAKCKFNETDRLCVLSFYEIRLKSSEKHLQTNEIGLRPYKYAQMFILRGLVGEWKQIVYYNFDCMMLSIVVKDLVRSLRDINYTVVALVSGIGPRKLAVWRNLNVTEEQPWFEVFENEKVFCFANVPHIIKRLRNHFLGNGFLVNNMTINVEPLSEMLSVESSDLWVSHDLTRAHIHPKKIGQHNLQKALQLFSQSVAETIRKCIAMGKMYSQHAIECSDFIQLVEEWFAVFNSKAVSSTGDLSPPAYGLALEEQNDTLVTMNALIRKVKIKPDQEGLEPFQLGILLNNSSLPGMLEYLKQKHDVHQVYTNNLNADDMEHSYGIRKSHGGVAFQPTPMEFKYRLRAGILVNLNVDA